MILERLYNNPENGAANPVFLISASLAPDFSKLRWFPIESDEQSDCWWEVQGFGKFAEPSAH
jgi:hypothetical protein